MVVRLCLSWHHTASCWAVIVLGWPRGPRLPPRTAGPGTGGGRSWNIFVIWNIFVDWNIVTWPSRGRAGRRRPAGGCGGEAGGGGRSAGRGGARLGWVTEWGNVPGRGAPPAGGRDGHCGGGKPAEGWSSTSSHPQHPSRPPPPPLYASPGSTPAASSLIHLEQITM